MLKGAVMRGDKCVLEFGDLYFEVTPAVAGRITAARLGAMDVLSPSSVNPTNYGSTFWTSPQTDWSWPPVPEVDSAAYTATAGSNSCTMVGPKVASPAHAGVDQISITKTFTADFAKNAVLVDYVIKNESTTAKRIAPWEITRVAGGGLTFYASDATPTKSNDFPITPTTTGAGAYWFKHSASVGQTKLFSDGKGWIAHVTPQNVILIKAFTDVPAGSAAPGEAEIEIYSAPTTDGSYVEVENQGRIEDIAPGASTKWTVRWYVRALPSTIMATPGNADLVAFVTQTIQ